MTRDQLLAIMPGAGVYAGIYLPHLVAAMAEFDIDTPTRQAAFLANLAHESGELCRVQENLNYSADGLASTWPTRYAQGDGNGRYLRAPKTNRYVPNALARQLHRNPEAIANNVYANRMGNGNEASGDGWANRGAGPIQLTGKDMHLAAALYFDIDPAKVREWLLTPEGGCRSAAWYWKTNNCSQFADVGDFDGVCDLINRGRKTKEVGDAIGYVDRKRYYVQACKVLGMKPISRGVIL